MPWGEGGGLPSEGFDPAMNSEFRELGGAVERFCAREEKPFRPADIAEQLVELARCRDMLDREFSKLAAVFEQSGEAEDLGAENALEWIRFACHMSVSDAVRRLVVGKHLKQMPQASKTLDRGEIGFGHVIHMAYNAQFMAGKGPAVFDEGPHLDSAVEESVSRFGHTCRNMRHVQDPEGSAQDEAAQVERRELRFYPQPDGMVRMSGDFDPVGGAAIQQVVKSLSKKAGPDDDRDAARRDADALIELALMSMDAGALPQTGGVRPHLNVTCSLETLMGLKGSDAGQLEYGGPISSAVVNRLACDSEITKILLDDRLIPVAIGHTRRTLTKKERQALDARDGGCRAPGCHRPASQCEAHHVQFYSRGGKTKLSNMILLCRYHHWRVHEGGSSLVLTKTGEVLLVPTQLGGQARAPGTSKAA